MIKEFMLDTENLKKIIKMMMAEAEVESMASLARDIDVKETTFRSAITNNSIRLIDFIKISELMGYEIKVEKKEDL